MYDIGFGILLGPLNEAVNSGINQLLDSGTQYNSNGGFLGRGMKIRGGAYTFAPFEWKRVDSQGDDIRKNVFPLPVKEPSDVMFKLLGLLIEYTDRIAGTTDPMVGVNPGQNTPAETSRNTMEQGMKVYSGIFKRIWRSLTEEFQKLHQLNALYLPLKQRFGTAGAYVNREDYLSNPDRIAPSADPNVISDQQRLQQAAMMRQSAHEVPGYNVAEVEKKWLRALKVDAIEKYYPGADKVPPLPNPKAQLEQMKLQGVKMKLDWEKQKFQGELLSQQKKTQAEINLLNAQVVKLLAEVQTDQVRLKIEGFELIIKSLEAHSNIVNSRLEAMKGEGDGGEGKQGTGGGEGMGGLENPSGDQAGAQLPQGQPVVSVSGGVASECQPV